MTTPTYVNDPIFQTLSSFCGMLGISLRFSNVKESYLGQSSVSKTFEIAMRPNELDPSKVLANKIAQYLIWDTFKDYSNCGGFILDSYCDQIGNGFYMLAEKISRPKNSTEENGSKRHKGRNGSMNYINKKQAAEKLFISTRTLDRMRLEGKIKAYAISERKLRFDSDEIDEYIRSTKEKADVNK